MNRVFALLTASTLFLASAPLAGAADDPCLLPPEDQPPQTEPVVACGTTTVTGVGGSTFRLRLPEDATVDLRGPGASVTGTGPLSGYVLAGAGGHHLYSFVLGSGFYNMSDPARRGGSFDSPETDKFLVPAGDYSLYLVSSGSQVSATVVFGGREGEIAVEATRTTGLDLEVLDSRAPDPGSNGQQHIYSVGKSGSLPEGGFLFLSVATVSPSPEPADSWGICYYDGIPSNEDLAYWPECPGRHLDGLNAVEVRQLVNPLSGEAFWTVSASPQGDRAFGLWRVGYGVQPRMASIGLFLKYDPVISEDAVRGSLPSRKRDVRRRMPGLG